MALLLLLLAADGVTLELTVDRTSVYAGEYIVLEGVARAATKSLLPPDCDLAIRGADGTEYRGRVKEHHHEELAAGGETRVFLTQQRIDPPLGDWKPRPPPLRDAGEWTAWFVMGDLRSNEVRWTVRVLKPDEIRKEPTAPQREAVRRLHARAPADGDIELLRTALLEAPNDGLAQHMLDLLERDEHPKTSHLTGLLVARAAGNARWFSTELDYGIDGPYLPRLGKLVLGTWDALDKDEVPRGIDAVIAWVRFHPEEKDARARLVALATKSAQLVEAPASHGMKVMTCAGPLPAVEAWRALLQVGELRPGMTVDEAVAILGKPTHRDEAHLVWYLNSPRHVNPGLRASVKDGRIVWFRTYVG